MKETFPPRAQPPDNYGTRVTANPLVERFNAEESAKHERNAAIDQLLSAAATVAKAIPIDASNDGYAVMPTGPLMDLKRAVIRAIEELGRQA